MKKPLQSTIRPLPYYTTEVTPDERALASALRKDFVPLLTRRLPGHHLRGFRHDYIINTVKRMKKKFPFFLRTDIEAFYPSVRHRDLVVGCQLAWRDLLGLGYVPAEFKKRYVGGLNDWCRSLPLTRGIPLGSPLSGVVAPLMLLPVWLEIKRELGVPVIVYMDDVLVMCRTEADTLAVYGHLERRLSLDHDLRLNPKKTSAGRFATDRVDFCGWTFSGGYATVSEAKYAGFRERIAEYVHHADGKTAAAFVKGLNRKVDGFGHYYKFGNVTRQFEALDAYVRREVRRWLKSCPSTTVGGSVEPTLRKLHSLEAIRLNLGGKARMLPAAKPQTAVRCDYHGDGRVDYLPVLERLDAKLNELIALQRQQLAALTA